MEERGYDLTLDFFFRLVAQNFATQLCAIAGLVWVLYDYFITLDLEINLVWGRSGIKSKLLYLFTRYYGIAFLAFDFLVLVKSGWSPQFCKVYFYIMGVGGITLLAVVEAALQIRVYVLYDCNKKLLWFNACFYLMEIAGMSILFFLDIGKYEPISTPMGITGCWCASIEATYSLGLWLFCLLYESWLSFLVGLKAYRSMKMFGFKSRVLTVVIRDSLLWFLMLGACLLFMCVSWTVFPNTQPGLILVGLPMTHASATIGGSRLLLNLRAAYLEETPDLSTAVETSTSAVWVRNKHRSVNTGTGRTFGGKNLLGGQDVENTLGGQDIEITEIWLAEEDNSDFEASLHRGRYREQRLSVAADLQR